MIAVIQGGHESEAEISRKTAKAFCEALTELNLEFRTVEFDNNFYEEIKKLNPSSCLIALHGKYGEDGVVQSILEYLRLPYTGSGVLASSLTFNKFRTQKLAKFIGVPVLENIYLKEVRALSEKQKQHIQSWAEGFVVKPSQSGSSRGVTLCENIGELDAALTEAFKWDKSVLVEKRIQGRELTVALFKGKAFMPIEIRPKTGFYNMKNKYTQGATDYLIPPPVKGEVIKKLQGYAEKIYEEFGLRTYGRADFLITDDEKECYMIEVNTLPGCTQTSLLPKALKYEKIEFSTLIKTLLEEAALDC